MQKLLLGLVLVAAAACGGEEEPPADRATTIAGLTGDATRGKTTFDAQCSVCHGATGQGGTGPALGDKDESTIIEAMLTGPGVMPEYTTLTDQEIADVAAHVVSL